MSTACDPLCSKKHHASPGPQAPSSEFAQSTWKVDWDLSTLEDCCGQPVHHLVSPPQGCGLWAPTPRGSDSELSWRCCMMAVLRHCIIHSGYRLRSGEVILVDAHVLCVQSGDCLGLPHGGTLSSIWTLWAQLGILCVPRSTMRVPVPRHPLNSPRAP